MKLPEKNAGFTLIEVTIALVILGIALVALAGLMATTTRNNATGGHLTVAATIAQDLLEKLRLMPSANLKAIYGDKAWNQYSYPDPNNNLMGITYTSNWNLDFDTIPNNILITINVNWTDPIKLQSHSITMVSTISQ